jgi:DNA-binding transcriptional MerR regulator
VVEEVRRAYPDVTHSSLRFLEREGLVRPTRTAGGHRLYSREEIGRILQIKAWQAQRIPLAEIRHRLAALDRLQPPDDVAKRFIALAQEGDQAAAARVILQADEIGMPLIQLFGEVLQPALYEVGERWASGALPVGQEKEISALTADLVAELSHRHAHSAPAGPLALAACVAGERHVLGLQMIAGLLRERGWRVHSLGPDVEPRYLLEVVLLREPAVVLLSASVESRLPAIRASIRSLNSFPPDRRPLVFVGGQGVQSHVEHVRAWGANPVGALQISRVLDDIVTGVERSAES